MNSLRVMAVPAALFVLLFSSIHLSADESEVESEPSLRIEPAFLPVFFQRGETQALAFNVENLRDEPLSVVCELQLGNRPGEVRNVDLAPKETRLVPFNLSIPADSPSPRQAWLRIREAIDPIAELAALRIMIRDSTDSMTDVAVVRNNLFDAQNRPVVLLVDRTDAESARRWLPVRMARQRLPLMGRPVFFFGPRRLFELLRNGSNDDHDTKFNLIGFDGDPLSACLEVPEPIPSDIPVAVVVAWGLDECRNRTDLRLFSRALDTMVVRLQSWNPQVRITVLVPPPVPGRSKACESYAEAIREIAKKRQTRTADWAEYVRSKSDWTEFYRLDGDPDILTELPFVLAEELTELLRRKL